MTEGTSSAFKIRSKSAVHKNYTNIELHSHLDDAKLYQDKVSCHLARSQYQNHVLLSAERFYEKHTPLRPSTSLSTLNRRSKMTVSTRLDGASSAFLNIQGSNPEGVVMTGLSMKTLRINDIKSVFDEDKEEKDSLKKRMALLKQKIAQEKNKKAKLSLRNCKLMNSSQISNHNINRLSEQSRKNFILRNELVDQILSLENQNQKIHDQNIKTQELIQKEKNSVINLIDLCAQTKKKCDHEKKLLQMWKEKATVSYKSMTNEYMKMNQLKEEKALLLNHIDIDFKNSF